MSENRIAAPQVADVVEEMAIVAVVAYHTDYNGCWECRLRDATGREHTRLVRDNRFVRNEVPT
jgi:hypothetical protein